MSLLYLLVTVGLLVAVVIGIARLQRARTNGFVIGGIICICFSVLFMVKLRCTTGNYNCGFMSFAGGFTWHLLPGVIAFMGSWILLAALLNSLHTLGWFAWMDRLGFSMAPLMGLWIALIWEILPVGVIHPPSHGGPCPSIPIICHDIPLMGRGGLLYWTAPFAIWAVVSVWRDTNKLLRESTT